MPNFERDVFVIANEEDDKLYSFKVPNIKILGISHLKIETSVPQTHLKESTLTYIKKLFCK